MAFSFRALEPTDWPWITERLPLKQVSDTMGIVAERDGALVAACVLDSWTANSVQAHQVLDTPFVLRHGFFELVAKYVFDQNGRKLMIGLVPSDNAHALKLDRKIGFVEHTRIPDAVSDGVDMVVLTMTPEQCNFYTPLQVLAAEGGSHGR